MTAFPKSGVTTKQARAKKRRALAALEREHKAAVRERDGGCRFPFCGCRAAARPYVLEVSHQIHKGMGGDPTGERSTSAGMIYLCSWRHKDGPVSIDRGTLRWEALTERGADGPVRWILNSTVNGAYKLPEFVVATETAVQQIEKPSYIQASVLDALARMMQ